VAILKVHSRGKALSKDIDFEKISRRTPGFTGADLQNLMNEAAIITARRGQKEISKEEVRACGSWLGCREDIRGVACLLTARSCACCSRVAWAWLQSLVRPVGVCLHTRVPSLQRLSVGCYAGGRRA